MREKARQAELRLSVRNVTFSPDWHPKNARSASDTLSCSTIRRRMDRTSDISSDALDAGSSPYPSGRPS
jgi:hypothetical protein